MKMTENMKRSEVECFQEKGFELSDEQLDEITGGRDMTIEEMRSELPAYMYPYVRNRESEHWPQFAELFGQYEEYIASLPEGSPEVLFYDTEYYEKLCKIVRQLMGWN